MKKSLEEISTKKPLVIQHIADTESSFSSTNQKSDPPLELFENIGQSKKNVLNSELPQPLATKTEFAVRANSFNLPKTPQK